MKLKNILKYVSLFIFVIFISAGSVEILMRGYVSYKDFSFIDAVKQIKSKQYSGNISLTNENGYNQLRPNINEVSITSEYSVSYSLNQLGLRDDSYQESENYILALGDSLTFGEGVSKDDSYVDQIEKGIGHQVLNLAAPGHSIGQVWNSLRHNSPLIKNVKGCILFYVKPLFWRNWMGRDEVSQDQKKMSTVKIERDSELISNYTLDDYFESFAYIRYLRMLSEIDKSLQEKSKNQWNITSEEHRKRKYHIHDTTNPEFISHNLFYISKIRDHCQKRSGQKLIIVNLDYGNEYEFLSKMEGVNYISLHIPLNNYSRKHPVSFKYDLHYNKEMHREISVLAIEEINKLFEKSAK